MKKAKNPKKQKDPSESITLEGSVDVITTSKRDIDALIRRLDDDGDEESYEFTVAGFRMGETWATEVATSWELVNLTMNRASLSTWGALCRAYDSIEACSERGLPISLDAGHAAKVCLDPLMLDAFAEGFVEAACLIQETIWERRREVAGC